MERNHNYLPLRTSPGTLQGHYTQTRPGRIPLHNDIPTTTVWICTKPLEKGHTNHDRKKPGFPLLHRLRGIIILEADYNWILRLIWGKRLFKNAAKKGKLMTAQQACPGFQSISSALNKVLAYDLMRLTKRSGGSFNNDAEGCYDRIVPPHAMLCCRRMGLPKSSATMLTKILNTTIYKNYKILYSQEKKTPTPTDTRKHSG